MTRVMEVKLMRRISVVMSVLALLVLTGCGQDPELEEYRQEILSLHAS